MCVYRKKKKFHSLEPARAHRTVAAPIPEIQGENWGQVAPKQFCKSGDADTRPRSTYFVRAGYISTTFSPIM